MKWRSGKGSRRAKKKSRRLALSKVRKAASRSASNGDLRRQINALTRELKEEREQRTATTEILKVISGSSGELDSVFNTILANATHLCEATWGNLFLREGAIFRSVAVNSRQGHIESWRRNPVFDLRENPGVPLDRVASTQQVLHITDLRADQSYIQKNARVVTLVEVTGARTYVSVPMLSKGELIGAISLFRQKVRSFTDKQIELVRSFAAQAVIAIENARLLNELRESLQQQTATADVLKVISSSPGELQPVFETMLQEAVQICDAKFGNIYRWDGDSLRLVAAHNTPLALVESRKTIPFRPGPETPTGRMVATKSTTHVADLAAERGYVEGDPLYVEAVDIGKIRTLLSVPMLKERELIGSFSIFREEVRPFTDKQIELVSNFAAQAVIAIENARLLNELRQRTHELATSLEDLRTTQDRLVQTEKLASLGQLTAGIAHEIKNPLNFVNNFSGISTELIGELQDTLGGISIDPKTHAELKELTDTLRSNLEKVVQHGKRADAIVKNMLLHSGQSSGELRSSDINALVEESLNRAYYNARAEKRGFTINLERSFDPAAGEADLFPREITRALLNLISNGFYAAAKRKAETKTGDHEPTLGAATKDLGDRVEIRIRDNGAGIPADVREKMFDPFFTTKPAGEGAGLGLSISHDIIVKQHGGSIEVDTKPGEFAEIRVILPRAMTLIPKRS
jgi:signal transduction histidine kinase/regulator of replication initiation timing